MKTNFPESHCYFEKLFIYKGLEFRFKALDEDTNPRDHFEFKDQSEMVEEKFENESPSFWFMAVVEFESFYTSLGCCSYSSFEEFMSEDSGYFQDMCEEVYKEAVEKHFRIQLYSYEEAGDCFNPYDAFNPDELPQAIEALKKSFHPDNFLSLIDLKGYEFGDSFLTKKDLEEKNKVENALEAYRVMPDDVTEPALFDCHYDFVAYVEGGFDFDHYLMDKENLENFADFMSSDFSNFAFRKLNGVEVFIYLSEDNQLEIIEPKTIKTVNGFKSLFDVTQWGLSTIDVAEKTEMIATVEKTEEVDKPESKDFTVFIKTPANGNFWAVFTSNDEKQCEGVARDLNEGFKFLKGAK